MRSVIAHYQEIALKEKNRPWFLHRLVRNVRWALSDLDVPEVRTPMGRIEIVLGSDEVWPEVRERMARMFGLGNFSLAHARAARSRHDRACAASRSARRPGRELPYCGAPRRQAISDSVTRTSSACSDGACRTRADGKSNLSRTGDADRRRASAQRGVLLLRQASRSRRIADGDGRARRRAALGRHRFAGCGVADDEARLRDRRWSTFTATRFSRAPRRTKHASSRGCSRAISSARRCIWFRSANCSGRSR